jgi:acyl-CoA synthetase (NDP forming)
LQRRKCCLLFHKKNLTEWSVRLPPTLAAQTGVEVGMAESRQKGPQTTKDAERPIEGNHRDTADEPNLGGGSQAAQRQTERVAELGRQGLQQAAGAPTVAAGAAQRSGTAVAEWTQEITAAWARYAEEVMRHTSEASQALLRARSFNEMLEVQAKLLRDNMQAFLDQSVRIAGSASRMATRPLEAMKEASSEQTRS